MSGKSGGAAKPARGSVTKPGSVSKSGRPRPGTGGYGRSKLEGKGPTPPAEQRPGHPAQRRAAAAAVAAARPAVTAAKGRPRSAVASTTSTRATRSTRSTTQPRSGSTRGAGNVAEIVAGRNAVLESLRAAVPATALHVGPRLDADERINEAIKLAADSGIPVVEAGPRRA